MLVGYKAIGGLIIKSCDVQEADFKTQLRNALERNSYYGASESKAFRVPCTYEKICFVNSTGVTSDDVDIPQIKAEVTAGTGRQIFMVKGGLVKDINFVVDGLEVQGKYFVLIPEAQILI